MVYQLYLLKEPAVCFIDLCYCFLHFFFIFLWSDLYDFFPSANFGGFFILLSLIALGVRLGCVFEIFLVFLFLFLVSYCTAINFSLGTAFAASHRFWVIMFSLSFVSRYFLISSLISSVISWLFGSILFSLHVLVFFLQFFPCNWYLVS